MFLITDSATFKKHWVVYQSIKYICTMAKSVPIPWLELSLQNKTDEVNEMWPVATKRGGGLAFMILVVIVAGCAYIK